MPEPAFVVEEVGPDRIQIRHVPTGAKFTFWISFRQLSRMPVIVGRRPDPACAAEAHRLAEAQARAGALID